MSESPYKDKIESLKKRIKRIEKRLDAYKKGMTDQQLAEYYTYHGGWSIGYWEGKLTAYEDMLIEFEEAHILFLNREEV